MEGSLKSREATLTLLGLQYDNPADSVTPPKAIEGGKGKKRWKSVWLDRYLNSGPDMTEYWSCELRLDSDGTATLDGERLRGNDLEAAKRVFAALGT